MSDDPLQPPAGGGPAEAAAAVRGHFRYESGHHGDLWLDLDELFVDARRMRGWAAALARQARSCRPDLVCGPLTGGAFLAQFIAAELDAGFACAERHLESGRPRYRFATAVARHLPGRRVLLVDDVVNAGSAWRATLAELRGAGATLAGFACLLTLGEAAGDLARANRVPLLTLGSLKRQIWPADACPLCAEGVPLVDRVPE